MSAFTPFPAFRIQALNSGLQVPWKDDVLPSRLLDEFPVVCLSKIGSSQMTCAQPELICIKCSTRMGGAKRSQNLFPAVFVVVRIPFMKSFLLSFRLVSFFRTDRDSHTIPVWVRQDYTQVQCLSACVMGLGEHHETAVFCFHEMRRQRFSQ